MKTIKLLSVVLASILFTTGCSQKLQSVIEQESKGKQAVVIAEPEQNQAGLYDFSDREKVMEDISFSMWLHLKSYLNAINEEDTSLLDYLTPDMKSYVSEKIKELQGNNYAVDETIIYIDLNELEIKHDSTPVRAEFYIFLKLSGYVSDGRHGTGVASDFYTMIFDEASQTWLADSYERVTDETRSAGLRARAEADNPTGFKLLNIDWFNSLLSGKAEAAEDDADKSQEEIYSREWKQAVWNFVKKHHEQQIKDWIGNEYEFVMGGSYGITLYNLYGNNRIGMDFGAWNIGIARGYADFYMLDKGSLNKVTEEGGMTVFYNPDTGEIDFILGYIRDSGMWGAGYYFLNNGEWEKHPVSYYGSVGTYIECRDDKEKQVTAEQYEKTQDSMIGDREIYETTDNFNVEYVDQSTLRAIPWSDIAVEFSKFLDNFDGIKIDMAGKESFDSGDNMTTTDWADTYAELVNKMRNDESYYKTGQDYGWGISNFTITDIDSDGTPELLIKYHGMGGGYNESVWVFDQNKAKSFEKLVGWDTYPNIPGIPLRYFENDRTGDIIFSSYSMHTAHCAIQYTRLDNFQPYKSIVCYYNGDEHEHYLDLGADTIESLKSRLPGDKCDMEYGRNSSDPTVIKLINMALEGYTEIPGLKKYEYDIGYQTGYDYDVKGVQNWIYEIAPIYDSNARTTFSGLYNLPDPIEYDVITGTYSRPG